MSQTSHPEDVLLNEYLDDSLSAMERDNLQRHLSVCAACARRLDALQCVFDVLAALPEKNLERDLSGGVRTTLQTPRSEIGRVRGGFWVLLAVEAGLSLVLLILTWQPQIFQSWWLGIQQGADRATLSLLVVCGRLLLQWQSLSHLIPDSAGWLAAGMRETLPVPTVTIGLVVTGLIWLIVHIVLLNGSFRKRG